MRLECEVLVVGAGPAGSSAARAAGEQGVDVLLLEKKARVGQPVQCGEFAPKLALKGLDLTGGLLKQETEYMETHLPGEEVVRTKGPGYIVDRGELDKRLALDAVQAGARLLTGAMVLRLRDEEVEIELGGQQVIVAAQIIIGADGPRSVVGRSIGEQNAEFALGAQYEVLLKERMTNTQVYFEEEFRGGYGWLFPRGRTANVGVGMTGVPQTDVWAQLDRFVARLAGEGKIDPSGIVGKSGGLIPVGGPLRTVKGRVMLAGDAAGQTHPITGAGIAQALECGRLAGEVAGRAVKRGTLASLPEYEAEWRAVFGDWLQIATDRRREMEKGWGKEEFEGLVKRCWVAFPSYRKWPG